ncbi:MAG UNVERIFIED_CONTAM: ribosome-associated translation inhibitor RaiA [Planctomycetaceae bacterium]|jgi:putative sigma-54 modulation protein
MQVSITCRHGSIQPELRDYISQKAEKLVRYLDAVSEIDVTLEFEGPRVDVELVVEIEGYHTIVAQVEGEDSRVAFDKALHKMEHQVHRYKEKIATADTPPPSPMPLAPPKKNTRRAHDHSRCRWSFSIDFSRSLTYTGFPLQN